MMCEIQNTVPRCDSVASAQRKRFLMERVRLLASVLFLIEVTATNVVTSYGIYVGKDVAVDGSSFLAGYGDEPSSHWLEIVPRQKHSTGATTKVGATKNARYSGELIEIPQVAHTAKYITMNYSAFAGFPAPLTNGGLNEHHVATHDIWSPSREELRRMTPNPQRGPHYSDLAWIVMERAKTARDAVEIVGELTGKHGFSTYGGNSHLFADADEGWIVINFAGGQGLWVAERLGADDIRVSQPGYIGEVPLDYQKNSNYMGSKNLVRHFPDRSCSDGPCGQLTRSIWEMSAQHQRSDATRCVSRWN